MFSCLVSGFKGNRILGKKVLYWRRMVPRVIVNPK